MDTATAADLSISAPQPGNLTICVSCGEMLIFGEGLKLEKIPSDIIREMQESYPEDYEQLKRAQLAVQWSKAQRDQKSESN